MSNERAAGRLLNAIFFQPRIEGLCETISYRKLMTDREYRCGRYFVVLRGLIDGDWEQWTWVQVWDHEDDEPEWFHIVLYWPHTDPAEFQWGWEHVPTSAEFGAIVDEHIEIREEARRRGIQ